MALSETTGTEAISTTEWSLLNDSSTLAASTNAGQVQAVLDVSDLVAGDELRLRLYEKARSGDTQRLVDQWTLITGSPGIWMSPVFLLQHGWDWSLLAVTGTVTVHWSIRRIPCTISETTGTEAVSTTEWSLLNDSSTLATSTSEGFVQPFIDVSDMVAGDELQFRQYEKCRSGDTQRVAFQRSLSGTQARPIWTHPAIILKNGWDMSLDAIAGTITCNWSIRRVAV